MANVTIRNIPDDVFEKIKRLSSLEKRSINSEMLVIIERGTSSEVEESMKRQRFIPRSAQVNSWKTLSREWEDTRTTAEILEDIYSSRTAGREFQL
jgi:plasmid stability protein